MATQTTSRPTNRPRLFRVAQPRPDVSAETISRLAVWAKTHHITFADLVYDFALRGGLRAAANRLASSSSDLPPAA